MIATVLPLLTATLLLSPDPVTPDAVVLSDDASWTLLPDGTVVEERQRRVKVLSDRAHRHHADPRIRFWEDAETVEILAARVTQADGTVVETPAYGRNLVTPGGYSGWPAFAAAREWVISMSGLEPQAVVELHWKKTSQPGTRPWLWGDIRLAEGNPVENRNVTVTIPEGRTLSYQLSGLPGSASEPQITRQEEKTTFRWTFKDLPADPDEPQAPSWRKWSPRLLFSTCAQADAFTAEVLKPVVQAASPAEAMKKPVQAAVQAALDDPARVRAVQKLLQDSMNFVDQAESWERMNCRPAEEVFATNYANPLEAGAVLVAMLRAAGFSASPALLVQSPDWDARAPVPEGIESVIARVELAGQTLWLHPAKGMVSGRSFPDHAILGSEPSLVPPRLSQQAIPAEIAIQGRLKLESDGTGAGELKLRFTGHAFDPEEVRTSDQQKSFVSGVVGKVAEGLTVDSFSVSTLSDEALDGTATVKFSKPLPTVGERRRLALGQDLPFMASTPVPLAAVRRRLPVELVGPVVETLDLKLDFPEGQLASATPSNIEHSFSDWAGVDLAVSGSDTSQLSIRRVVRIAQTEIAATDFIPLRDAINELRAASSRTIVFGK